MRISETFRGSLCGILSAVTYGMNPLFGLPLYHRGLTTSSVLFYRFLFTILLLGCFMLIRKESFRLNRNQILPMGSGGVLLALSCLFLFLSFHHLNAGIAATILFIYPVMVCAIMFFGFHVRQSLPTLIGMVLAICGIGLLSTGDAGGKFSMAGLLFSLLSALSYAIYMVLLKVTSIQKLPAATLTFYALCFGFPVFLIALKGGTELQMLPDFFSFGCALGLAICPSLLSFLLMAVAIRAIGPTKTAILGALEPVTALFFGILVFGERVSLRQSIGILIILGSVTLVVAGKKRRLHGPGQEKLRAGGPHPRILNRHSTGKAPAPCRSLPETPVRQGSAFRSGAASRPDTPPASPDTPGGTGRTPPQRPSSTNSTRAG